MTTPFSFPIYDSHIYEALKELQALNADGIAQLRLAMSVLVYRLNKLLCTEPAPPPGDIGALLDADIAEHVLRKPESAELSPALDRAKVLLLKVLELAGWYAVDRVLARTRPEATDSIHHKQNPSLRKINEPHASWGRPLPFRPMF